jgi:hypothetical protein
MEHQEIRLRCLEAAARNPTPHADGYAAGAVAAAQKFYEFVTHGGTVQAPPPQQEPVKVVDFF